MTYREFREQPEHVIVMPNYQFIFRNYEEDFTLIEVAMAGLVVEDDGIKHHHWETALTRCPNIQAHAIYENIINPERL